MTLDYNPSSFVMFKEHGKTGPKREWGMDKNKRRNIKVSADHFKLASELKAYFGCIKWDILFEKLHDIYCEPNTD